MRIRNACVYLMWFALVLRAQPQQQQQNANKKRASSWITPAPRPPALRLSYAAQHLTSHVDADVDARRCAALAIRCRHNVGRRTRSRSRSRSVGSCSFVCISSFGFGQQIDKWCMLMPTATVMSRAWTAISMLNLSSSSSSHNGSRNGYCVCHDVDAFNEVMLMYVQHANWLTSLLLHLLPSLCYSTALPCLQTRKCKVEVEPSCCCCGYWII